MKTSFWLAEHSPDKMLVNGVCSDTVGLYVDRPPMPPMGAEKVDTYEIPNTNGSVVRRSGTYDDITLTVKCFVFDGGYHPEEIYKYLSGAKTVEFSRCPDYFYKVKKVNGITPSYKQLGKNYLQVVFTCEAFRYSVDNAPQTESGSTVTIYNRGNVPCEPVYALALSSEATDETLTVNDEELAISASTLAGETLFVDVARKKVYYINDGVATIVQNLTSGRFWAMVLQTGWNTVELSAGITSVEVTKNERWL